MDFSQASEQSGQPIPNAGNIHYAVVDYPLDALRPHPSYVRLGFSVPTCKISALAQQGDLAFQEPILITDERIVIDGYARWELARLNKRPTLSCIAYNVTDEETLRWLLRKHRRSPGMNDFCRILLALELEPCLKEKALSNQRIGGLMKQSSNLTEAAKIDVRQEIAAAAGVSVGNVSKVKFLVNAGDPKLLEAIRIGEVSIHRAWKWIKEDPSHQLEMLTAHRSRRGIHKTIRELVSRHRPQRSPLGPDLGRLIRRLSTLSQDQSSSIRVSVIRAPGKALYVSEELIESLAPYQEAIPVCKDDNR